ncbi:AraC family transcriptional regulator [Mesorhizobium sp. YC-39]|uniref:AraC family transcriptional regulator n=1 Tax=unclassified Mesorhizobium TaxID=325217 RepID=UPI0021E95F36|nr:MULTISPECIES: AraC family transcriptional regulator [unclassified Mesorhizobium]MCV3207362.1 AraC family transcriptional regulator [Mesorhizobium sp. YC-2]MCV3229089.1 AraC family transcriptional regulator [Mesorhizobium sp. YC-39]
MTSSLLAAVNAYIEEQGGGQGLFPTLIEGFNIVRSFQAMLPVRAIYRPSLCVVLQGAKEIHFGDDRLDYGAMDCLVVSVELPATGRIVEASAEAPYIGVVIDFDVAVVRDVLEQLEEPPEPIAESGPCVFVGRVDETLVDCVMRLMRMTASPKSIPILYPSVMREICYWLVSGPRGGELRKLVLPESNVERVAKAISALHLNFARTLRIEQLAELAGMSPSSFHQHFKALTSMTPLQFQKQLRLLEARRLMVSEAANVSDAAYRVGYESVSQFSREYSREFGIAPKQDALNQQRLYKTYASRSVRTA